MTNFVNELETRYPSYEETQALVQEAHRLRAQAVRESLLGIRDLLQRAVARAVTRSPSAGVAHKA
jgi:hypothetical protein